MSIVSPTVGVQFLCVIRFLFFSNPLLLLVCMVITKNEQVTELALKENDYLTAAERHEKISFVDSFWGIA